MPELEEQLQRYADHVETRVGPISTDRPRRPDRRRWMLVVAAAAVVVVLVAVVITVDRGGNDVDVVDDPPARSTSTEPTTPSVDDAAPLAEELGIEPSATVRTPDVVGLFADTALATLRNVGVDAAYTFEQTREQLLAVRLGLGFRQQSRDIDDEWLLLHRFCVCFLSAHRHREQVGNFAHRGHRRVRRREVLGPFRSDAVQPCRLEPCVRSARDVDLWMIADVERLFRRHASAVHGFFENRPRRLCNAGFDCGYHGVEKMANTDSLEIGVAVGYSDDGEVLLKDGKRWHNVGKELDPIAGGVEYGKRIFHQVLGIPDLERHPSEHHLA